MSRRRNKEEICQQPKKKNTVSGSVPAEAPDSAPAAKSKNAEVLRVVKFVLFSVSAGLIEMGTFALLNETLHLDYWLSYMVLNLVAEFLYQRFFVFGNSLDTQKK